MGPGRRLPPEKAAALHPVSSSFASLDGFCTLSFCYVQIVCVLFVYDGVLTHIGYDLYSVLRIGCVGVWTRPMQTILVVMHARSFGHILASSG